MTASLINMQNVFINLLYTMGCDLGLEITNKYDALKLCMAFAWACLILFFFLNFIYKFFCGCMTGRAYR